MPAASTKSKSKSQTTNGSTLLYVYCAARKPLAARALSNLPTMPDGERPRIIDLSKDIALVVANVRRDKYRSDVIEARLADLDWVSRCGSAHHAIADALVPKHTIVPFRMFTLFETEERARVALAGAVSRIAAALDRVRGKSEWVLRIGLPDPGRVAAAPGGSPSAAKSGTSFLAQKAATKRATADRTERVRTNAQQVFDRLTDLADESNRRPLESAPGFLVDAAFLIGARRIETFRRELSAAAESLLEDGCRVSLTGPWPPYSFVDLDHQGDVD